MKERNLVWLNRAVVAVAGVFALIGSVMAVLIAGFETWFSAYGGFMALLSLSFAALTWILIGQQPRNAVIWTMSAAALGAGWWLLGLGLATLVASDSAEQVNLIVSNALVPASVEPAAALIMMAAESVGLMGLYVTLTFGLLLFPDGRLPSRAWRWAARYCAFAIILTFASALWAHRLSNTSPVSNDVSYGASTTLAAAGFLLCLAGLLARFRRSSGAEREQFKWVVWGALVFVPALVLAILLGNTLGLVILMIGEVAFLGAFAVAVSRYRLFDVDVVISRTVVVAGLASFVTLVYGVLVGAVGLFVGFGTNAALPLSIAATVVVALAFQPLRERMRRWADRLVYGERATPYEVLSRFSSQVRSTVAADQAIPDLARLLAMGTGAERTTVWSRTQEGMRAAGVWPATAEVAEANIDDEMLTIQGVDHVARVEQQGELLGAVSVTMPANDGLTGAQRRLIDDVAAQAGMVLRNGLLIEDLHASRQRLVAAQDEERRRLERDLHDGAQQQFVAVKMKVSMAKRLVESGNEAQADDLLDQATSDIDDGVQALRDLAHGIYPPLLEAEGLPTALRARARRAPIEVSVSTHEIKRYPPEVEAAVYFCVLEALQNAIKHSDAGHVDMSLTHEDGVLSFRVSDNGRGFDTVAQRGSRGLFNMSDRIETLEGSLSIESTPGSGTSVVGHIPV